MRKLGLACLVFAVASAAYAKDFTLFNAATADGTMSLDGLAYVETGGSSKCECQVTSAAGSVATIYLEGSISKDGPWANVATLTDPGTADEDKFGFFTCPSFFRARIGGYANGAITVKLRTSNP